MKGIIKKAIVTALTIAIFAASGVLFKENILAADAAGQTISFGNRYTMVIKEDNSLWAWGENSDGQLGDGTIQSKSTLVKIMDGVASVSVSTGYSYTMAIKTDGSLWSWGYNFYGQLGDGTTENKRSPVKIMDGVSSVLTGSTHTMAIKTDGSLWSWGWSLNGNLGDASIEENERKLVPGKIMDGVASVHIFSRSDKPRTMAIKKDGSLWAWGNNSSGSLGDGTTIDKHTPVKVLDGVTAVSGGTLHTMAVKTDGTLWAWGNNYSGQLGDGTDENSSRPIKVMNDVSVISAEDYYTMAIKKDGSLWDVGNYFCQRDNGATKIASKPVKVMDGVNSVVAGDKYAMAIKKDDSLWAWGQYENGQLWDWSTKITSEPIKVMDDVVSVVINNFIYERIIVIKKDGSLWTWGKNSSPSLLGDGTIYDQLTPIKIMDGVKLPTVSPATVVPPTPTPAPTPTPPAAQKQRKNILQYGFLSMEADIDIKIVDGRALVPLRDGAELLGATVTWNDKTKKATSELNGMKIDFIIGSKKYYVNGVEKTMDVVPFMENGSMFIPIRYAAEGLGYKVEFKQTDTANIYKISEIK